MNCKKCGSLLTENDKFCKNCGAAVTMENAQTNNMVQQTPENNMSYNTQPTQQPAWTNSYNTQQNYNQQPNKNSNAKFIILGIVIVVIIFAGIIMFNVFGENNATNTGTNDNQSTNSGSTTTQPTTVSSTYKVNYEGFQFDIPTDLIYEKKSNALAIGDEANTWVASLEVISGNYSQYKSNKSALQVSCQRTGYTCSQASVKTIEGLEFITLEISYSGYNMIMALAKANSMYSFGVTSMTEDNEYDYEVMKKVATILKSAKYVGEGNNMETKGNINLDFVKDALK